MLCTATGGRTAIHVAAMAFVWHCIVTPNFGRQGMMGCMPPQGAKNDSVHETHLGHAQLLDKIDPMFSPCWMLLPSRTCVCTCVPARVDCVLTRAASAHSYSRASATEPFNCSSQKIYPAAMDQPLCDPSPKLKLANEQTFLSPTCSCLQKPSSTKAMPSYLYTNAYASWHVHTLHNLMVLSLVDSSILLPQEVLHHLTLLIFSSISRDLR